MPTRGAFRINALHSPSWQVLHSHPSNDPIFSATAPEPKNTAEKLSGFCGDAIVVSRQKIQYLVVVLQAVENPIPLRGGPERGGAIVPWDTIVLARSTAGAMRKIFLETG